MKKLVAAMVSFFGGTETIYFSLSVVMDLLWSLLPAVILALVIFRHFRRKNGPYKSFFSLPGPKSLPLIGEATSNN